MDIALIIVLGVLALAICIILALIIYHQMLLINEVNKRLQLFASEAIEKERIAMSELQEALKDLESHHHVDVKNTFDFDTGFNPHEADTDGIE